MFYLAQRAVVALCLFLLFGCSTPPCRQWELDEILTDSPCFSGARLLLEADCNIAPMELEIVQSKSTIRFYVNLFSAEARRWEGDPTRTELEVLFEGQDPWIVYPYLFVGGQKLLFPEEITESLIQSLLDNQSFRLRIGRYSIYVIPDNFAHVYQNFIKKIDKI